MHRMSEGAGSWSPIHGIVSVGDSVVCGVCGDLCKGERNDPYDTFFCPNNGIDWHQQAEQLFSMGHSHISPTLRSIYLEDACKVAQARRKL